MTKLPRLTGKRLVLRPYRPSDKPFFQTVVSDEKTMRHLGGALSADDSADLFRQFTCDDPGHGIDAWAVTLAHNEVLIGHAAIKPPDSEGRREMVFLVAREYWGSGYGLEIARCLLEYAFKHTECRMVVGTADPENIPSTKTMEKAGMLLNHWTEDEKGRYPVYAITRELYESTAK